MDEHDEPTGRGRSSWNTDATADYPIGPDDSGNAVMHAISMLVTGWRWLSGKLTNRS